MNLKEYNVQDIFCDVFEKKCRLIKSTNVVAPSELKLLTYC